MVRLEQFNPYTKKITLADDAFNPELTTTLGLYEVYHWNYVAKKQHMTRNDHIMIKVKRYGGNAWIQRELDKIQAKDIVYAKIIESTQADNQTY